ncbi:quinone oxidoreductase PIG3 isoform X1 [Erpetoichthys calabaricus]|nr:quinone oxidoreductase PIG3 isoform X1 [Erpetoichthys calabaricus]
MQGKMLAVHFDSPGEAENLYIKEVARPEPSEGEVLIKVHASALNRADLLQRRGFYLPPPGASEILGLEAAGVVVSEGADWSVGDRVMALLSGGGNAEYVTVPEDQLMAIPNQMTFIQAAAIPEAWLTAYQLLHFVAEVKNGETVLIHAGGSGVGTAAIQLCRLAGAVPVVTAGSADKLKKSMELGAAAGFNYKEEDFSSCLLTFTKGHGADIILDCVGASMWEQNVKCLSMDGRWVLYGTMGGVEVHGDILRQLLFKRGQLLTSLLRSRSPEYKSKLVKTFDENVLPYFSSDSRTPLHPVIDSIYKMDEIVSAHKHMEGNKNLGKIIINLDSED